MQDGVAVNGCVVFVGWRLAVPSGVGKSIQLDAERLARMSLAGCRVVVLGKSAIEQLDPACVDGYLAPVRDRVVICVDACAADLLSAWYRLGYTHAVATVDLPGVLRNRTEWRRRPTIPAERWLGRLPPADSDASLAIAEVCFIDRLRVGDWAARLGWSRSRLLKTCRSSLGMHAKAVLHRYLVVAFEQLRRDGATWEDCAETLGYSDASALRDAVAAVRTRRTATPIPPVKTSNPPVQGRVTLVSLRQPREGMRHDQDKLRRP